LKETGKVADCTFPQQNANSTAQTKQFATSENTANTKITPAVTLADGVESALALALTEAAKAGRFDVVSQLARELEARRLASTPNVVTLDTGKRGAR
jgi:hypothetical protein